MTGRVQRNGLQGPVVEQDGEVFPIALVQINVLDGTGQRREVHQLAADNERVVVVGVEEPVLQADQAIGGRASARRRGRHVADDGPSREPSGDACVVHRPGEIEVRLGGLPWVKDPRVGELMMG